MHERASSTNIHPGIILKEEILDANQLTISQGASLLAISRLTLSKITNGKRAITPNIALRIERAFGGNADFWLRMQRGHDLIIEQEKFKNNPPKIKRFEFQKA